MRKVACPYGDPAGTELELLFGRFKAIEPDSPHQHDLNAEKDNQPKPKAPKSYDGRKAKMEEK